MVVVCILNGFVYFSSDIIASTYKYIKLLMHATLWTDVSCYSL